MSSRIEFKAGKPATGAPRFRHSGGEAAHEVVLDWPGGGARLVVNGVFHNDGNVRTGLRITSRETTPVDHGPRAGTFPPPGPPTEIVEPGTYDVSFGRGVVHIAAWGPPTLNWAVEVDISEAPRPLKNPAELNLDVSTSEVEVRH